MIHELTGISPHVVDLAKRQARHYVLRILKEGFENWVPYDHGRNRVE
jgi:hypothetical protein